MPSTAAFAASAGPSHSFVKNQLCALSALNSASSSRSIRKIGVLRRRSQSARGFEAAIGVLVDVAHTAVKFTPLLSVRMRNSVVVCLVAYAAATGRPLGNRLAELVHQDPLNEE